VDALIYRRGYVGNSFAQFRNSSLLLASNDKETKCSFQSCDLYSLGCSQRRHSKQGICLKTRWTSWSVRGQVRVENCTGWDFLYTDTSCCLRLLLSVAWPAQRIHAKILLHFIARVNFSRRLVAIIRLATLSDQYLCRRVCELLTVPDDLSLSPNIQFEQKFSLIPKPKRLKRYGDGIRAWRPRNRTSMHNRSIFPFFIVLRPGLSPTQPPIQWVKGVLSPRVEQPEVRSYHSPLCSAEVKNARNVIFTPPYVFMA
jgi:hypothetical protein